MILGKFSRFIKRYNLTFTPRHKAAARLNIVDKGDKPSILKALQRAIHMNKASVKTATGDEVELLKVLHDDKKGVIVLLFHRASPNAADPMYRKRNPKREVTVRAATKEIDEEQSLSAHFVINTRPMSPGRFKSALEEVPGISIGAIQPIISEALRSYTYDYKDGNGDSQESYAMLKSAGVKSETLSGALRRGHLNYITLIRPGDSGMVDAEGLFRPIDQRMKIRITATTIDAKFLEKVDNFIKNARAKGWDQFDVDLSLDDERRRTVKVERDQDAKDILFVRAEEVNVKRELPVCSTVIIDELVDQAVGVMARI